MKRTTLILLIIAGVLIIITGSFVLTVTMSSPTEMTLLMPKDSEKDSVDNKYEQIKKKLTLILLKDEIVFGYYGDFIKGGRSVSLDETSKLIADGWKMFSKDSLAVVIKPTEDASYKATVDVLDQMAINEIKKYVMIDPDKKEKEFLKIGE